jgi:hypothetical protein
MYSLGGDKGKSLYVFNRDTIFSPCISTHSWLNSQTQNLWIQRTDCIKKKA